MQRITVPSLGRIGSGVKSKLLLSLLCAGSLQASTYYVNDANLGGDVYTSAVGSNANPGTAASPFLNIQTAIDVATAGDTIYVDAGTYLEDLNVNKASLVIIGAGMSLTTIDHTGSPGHGNAGIHITQSDVEMSEFTLTGNAAASVPRYGLKVGGSANTTDNVVLQNIRVQNSFRTGFDLARPKNISLIGVEAMNNGGAGIFMNNAEGAALTDITTSGNPWTGVSIATRNDWGGDTYGVVFSGTNSFGENASDNGGVQIESDNTMLISWSNNLADGKDVTIQAGELDYVLSGPTTNTFGAITYAPYFRFYETLAQGSSAAAGSPDHVDAPRYLRDADNSDGTASTHFYVYNNGNMTIKAALDQAIDGNTINVGDGTYVGNVIVNKNISLLSMNGAASTTLDGDNAGAGLGTVFLSTGRNGVTIGSMGHGFNIKGIDGPAGLEKAALYLQGAQSNISIVDNIIEARGDAGLMGEYSASNDNVVIDNNHFTGQTFNGPNPAGVGSAAQFTLLNVPRQAIVFGGGSGTSAMNFTFTNNEISTITGGQSITDNSGNPIAPTDQGNMLVTLDLVGANLIRGNTFNGTTVSWYAALRTRGTGYTIDSNIFNGNYFVGMATAANPVNASHNYWGAASGPYNAVNNPCGTGKAVPNNVAFAPFYVDEAFSATGTSAPSVTNITQNTTFCTIQSAVDAANPTDTLEASAGTFVEQVEISKDLMLMGQGAGLTIVKGMANMPLSFTTSAANHPVIYVHNAANVILKGFTLDGDGKGNTNYRYMGIAYSSAGGMVDSVEVTGVRNTPLDGSQHGIGIFGDVSDTNYTKTLTVQNSRVVDFQKNAMSFSGTLLTINTYNNEVIGAGPLGVPMPAQNGIQYYGVAAGEIMGNHIHGFEYTPSSWTASGILLYSNVGTIDVSENLLENNEIHLYNFNSSAVVNANTVDNGDYGILGYESGVNVNMTITNNFLTNLQRGITGYGGGANTVVIEAHDNSITAMDSFAIENSGSGVTLNADCNWYGATDSATIAGLISGTVDYSPWLTNGTDNDAAAGFQPVPGACNGGPGAPAMYLVSDSSWRLSTVTTTATANSYPWPGVTTVPNAATFSQPVTVGQPYPWEHIWSINGSNVITSLSGVTYYRKTFDLVDHTNLNVRLRMYVDDNMQVFINGQWVAMEDDMGPDVWRGAGRDLLFKDDGTVDNGYSGGTPWAYVTSEDIENILQTGTNDIVLAIRNRSNRPDRGGFSFRMDIDQNGTGVIVKSANASPSVASNEGALSLDIYPNPTNGILNIVPVSLDKEEAMEVVLFDINGRIVRSMSYDNPFAGEAITLDLSNLAKGVYSLRVESGNEFTVERIILN